MGDTGRATDWLLTKEERGNPATRLDDGHPGSSAWSDGNRVRPLIDGATYFAELFERLEATRRGDLVLFTDWQGDADEQLTDAPESEIGEVLARADERGVDVRGLVWRSHSKGLGFSAGANRELGEELQARGAEVLLDMRVRAAGAHHQKLVVIRHQGDPRRDIAYVGGIDLCHSRRDDREHAGDRQAVALAEEYGPTPPWHDVQAAIEGPAVHDVETVFRERWEDPARLSRNPLHVVRDRWRGLDLSTDPLPEQAAPPPPVDGGTHVVQLLRTYPKLRARRDYPFAPGGERSIARGYAKALSRARQLVYIEDQYFWSDPVGDALTTALTASPALRVVVVMPRYPDVSSASRTSQLLGRRKAMAEMARAAPGRVAFYSLENRVGTPVYVHAKVFIVDDTWATIGSNNLNRRSWTHDSELGAAVVDRSGHTGFARRLRLTLAAEHLDRDSPAPDGHLEDPTTMTDCVEPAGMFDAFDACADALDRWHASGRVGPRPAGRLRRLEPPELGPFQKVAALAPYLLMHDPDGRPRRMHRRGEY